MQALIELRRDIPLFRQSAYLHGSPAPAIGRDDIEWLSPDGRLMGESDWADAQCLSVVLSHTSRSFRGTTPAVVLLINASRRSKRFTLPDIGTRRDWQIRFVSAAKNFRPLSGNRWQLPAKSIVCVALAERSTA